ncbi:MAG: hypothetical protein ACI8UO_004090 [Verrucomicrobiales bacterium]|jgi:hypothetical protein
MKKTIHGKSKSDSKDQNQGIALITVLSILSLAAVLIMAFFSLTRNELASSSKYSEGLQAQQLSQTAVNMVMHQIRSATDMTGAAWASQPGMIRTWRDSQFKAFKLYSDDQMVLNSKSELSNDPLEMRDWDSDEFRAIYTDLNEPVIRGDKVHYPIADPRAWPQGAISGGKPKAAWTIDEDLRHVEGFYYATDDVKIDKYAKAQADHQVGLPMPVKWLYQLEDGTLGYLDQSKRFNRISGAGTPAKENPITSRIAFWADDESVKVNINTAAGGRPWDIPRAAGAIDRSYGAFQPVQREWQRYPAHPATVSLLPIFYPNQIMTVGAGYNSRPMKFIYVIAPRVRGGGSESGTVKNRRAEPLEPDHDRLYATVDELIFQAPSLNADQTEAYVGKGMDMPRNLNQFPEMRGEKVDAEYINRVQFFLTANSVAPETTVFNTPRISMWPSYYGNPSTDKGYYSAFDQRIRFCAEVGDSGGDQTKFPSGKFIYHFQRRDSESRTYDYAEIERNQELYSYLQWLTEQPIPGVGKSLESKYGSGETDQIITEIFDYVRSTNLFDDTVLSESSDAGGVRPWKDNTNEHKTYTNYRVGWAGGKFVEDRTNDAVSTRQHPGHGQVAPIEIGDTKGFGRFFGLMETGIGFLCMAEGIEGPDGTDQIGGIGRAPWIIEDQEWVLPPAATRQEQIQKNYHFSNIVPLSQPVPTELASAGDAERSRISVMYYKSPNYFRHHTVGVNTDNAVTNPLKVAEWSLIANPENWNFGLERDKPLEADEKRVQAMLMFQIFCPSKGWTALNGDFRMEVDISGFGVDGKDLGLRSGVLKTAHTSWLELHGSRDNGGVIEPRGFLVGQGEAGNGRVYNFIPRYATWAGGGPGDSGDVSPEMKDNPSRAFDGAGYKPPTSDPSGGDPKHAVEYPWVSAPLTVSKNARTSGNRTTSADTMHFDGGSMVIRLYPGDGFGSDSDNPNGGSGDFSQQVSIDMAASDVPLPNLKNGNRGWYENDQYDPKHHGPAIPNTEVEAPSNWTFHRDGLYKRAGGNPERSRVRSVGGRIAHTRGHQAGGRSLLYGGETDSSLSYVIPHGDVRIVNAKRITSSGSDFEPQLHYTTGNKYIRSNFYYGNNASGYGTNYGDVKALTQGIKTAGGKRPHLPANYDFDNYWGDFDNTMALEGDGPFINKPDEGNARGIGKENFIPHHSGRRKPVARDYIPYFSQPWVQEPAGASFFSPNRIMPSPGMIGSLPTGVKSGQPWQTILLRPQNRSVVSGASNGGVHPGTEDPKDHYFLDFFWMPVVEPWSISSPLATAGKININYDIQPFKHIQRSSGVRAVFASEEMLTIPKKNAVDYTSGWGYGKGYDRFRNTGGTLKNTSLRSTINSFETLKQFTRKFDEEEDIFISASQICEMHLVPSGINGLDVNATLDLMERDDTFWSGNPSNQKYGFGLVGDNSREKPYSNIYQRITTKSNTFQVHYRSQVVKQSKMSPSNPNQRRSDDEYATFDPDVDSVVSEYRGATIIERYVDPNDDRIPDYATNPPPVGSTGGSGTSLDEFYRFRILSMKRFAP